MARRGSANWAIDNYGKPCVGGDIVSCQWYPGLTKNQIAVHRGTERIWKALGAVMLAYNYKIPTSYVGAYACRPITGGGSMSRHSWPLAMDINAATNPYRRTPSRRTIKWGVETDMPAAMVAEIEKITADGFKAFGWGGRWRSVKDAMHYQVHVTLGEIAGEVYAPRGFYEGGGAPPPGGDEEMSLSKGDKGNAVGKHQEGLIVWNPAALPKFGADKDFGGETEEWVKNYQKAADLDQTGVIDGVTSALIISYTVEGGGGGKHSHPATASVVEGTKVSVTVGESA
jgi:D-alanyl-D-alanine carboxypeptidase/Putative peptidoglycan binding domain